MALKPGVRLGTGLSALRGVVGSRAKPSSPPAVDEGVTVRLLTTANELSAPYSQVAIVKSDEEWLQQLGPEAYAVVRDKGTEPAYCGDLVDTKEPGVYACAGCGLPLFAAAKKFHSGTGWPSFYQPFADENIARRSDTSLGMARVEILCARCGAHLGHVFGDGPPPTGLRYCLNSLSLHFIAVADLAAGESSQVAVERTAIFAGGCFWGIEELFRRRDGVLATEVGYIGGTLTEPTYEQVCTGRTGHAEAVRVTYDSSLVGYDDLLRLFFGGHDPTTVDRQGPDVGRQYRSAVFVLDDEQARRVAAVVAELEERGEYGDPIVTEIVPVDEFWPAEAYHQQYIEKRRRARS